MVTTNALRSETCGTSKKEVKMGCSTPDGYIPKTLDQSLKDLEANLGFDFNKGPK